MRLTSQQYKAIMTLLQQQSSVHNNSHVNQIGTITGSNNELNIWQNVPNLKWTKNSRKHNHFSNKNEVVAYVSFKRFWVQVIVKHFKLVNVPMNCFLLCK